MAAGDITTTLVARIRTYLDEASAGFWTQDEIYKALTDGQREVISFVLAIYKQKIAVNPDEKLPEVLRSCFYTTGGVGSGVLPAGFLFPLSVYTSTVPVYIRPDGIQRGASKLNTYLTSSSTQPFCSFSGTQIVFETSVTWTMEYLSLPLNDIDATHDPALSAISYNAIIEYATAFLLNKDENQRAQQHLSKFFNEVQNLSF